MRPYVNQTLLYTGNGECPCYSTLVNIIKSDHTTVMLSPLVCPCTILKLFAIFFLVMPYIPYQFDSVAPERSSQCLKAVSDCKRCLISYFLCRSELSAVKISNKANCNVLSQSVALLFYSRM